MSDHDARKETLTARQIESVAEPGSLGLELPVLVSLTVPPSAGIWTRRTWMSARSPDWARPWI